MCRNGFWFQSNFNRTWSQLTQAAHNLYWKLGERLVWRWWSNLEVANSCYSRDEPISESDGGHGVGRSSSVQRFSRPMCTHESCFTSPSVGSVFARAPELYQIYLETCSEVEFVFVVVRSVYAQSCASRTRGGQCMITYICFKNTFVFNFNVRSGTIRGPSYSVLQNFYGFFRKITEKSVKLYRFTEFLQNFYGNP